MKKNKRIRDKRDALPPACFKDKDFFSEDGSVCRSCPFYFPCSANVYGAELSKVVTRDGMENTMLQKRVPNKIAIEAVSKAFGVSMNAAALSYSRRRRASK
jgi:hypothetical protein